MVFHVFVWLLAVSVISGCASTRPPKAQQRLKRQTMMEVYAESVGQSRKDMSAFIEGKLSEGETFGYVKPYVPVVEAPVVRKVWVPDQKSSNDPDVLVAGHWSYVMVQGPKWFIDTQQEEEEPQEIVPLAPVSAGSSAPGQGVNKRKGKN